MNATKKEIKPCVLISGDNSYEVKLLERFLAAEGYSLLRDDAADSEERLKGELFGVIVFASAEVTRETCQRVSKLKETYGLPVLAIIPILDDASSALIPDIRADAIIFLPLRLEELSLRLSLLCRSAGLTADGKVSLTDWACRLSAVAPNTMHPNKKQNFPLDPQIWEWKNASIVPQEEGKNGFYVNEREKSVVIDGRKLNLTPTEFKLFSLLASDPGKVFSKEEIIAELWPKTGRHSASDVHQFIRYLRAKLEIDPSQPQWIKTVRRCGYMFDPLGAGH